MKTMRAFNRYTIEATYIVIQYYGLQCICKCLALHFGAPCKEITKQNNEKTNSINTLCSSSMFLTKASKHADMSKI